MLKNYFLVFCRHSRENGNPVFSRAFWMPAFAGMTILGHKSDFFSALLDGRRPVFLFYPYLSENVIIKTAGNGAPFAKLILMGKCSDNAVVDIRSKYAALLSRGPFPTTKYSGSSGV
ncbi:MAG: hypothetical protein HZA02_02915 [Nitrospinae bacterium]|nr:hypothetical protein [Nitrospinota bacterium]